MRKRVYYRKGVRFEENLNTNPGSNCNANGIEVCNVNESSSNGNEKIEAPYIMSPLARLLTKGLCHVADNSDQIVLYAALKFIGI